MTVSRLKREQLKIILQGISDGVTVMDRSGSFIFANEIGAEMCGSASPDELIGTPSREIMDKFEIFDESGNPFAIERLPGRMALQGVSEPPEALIYVRNKETGEERWSLVKAKPVRDPETDDLMAVSIFKDFTERKRSEQDMKYLDEVNTILGSSLNYKQNLTALGKLLVPRIAEWFSIELIRPGSQGIETAVVYHMDSNKQHFAQEFRKKYPYDESAPVGVPHVIRTGTSEFYPVVTEEMIRKGARSEQHFEDVLSLGMKSAIIVPLKARGTTLGAMVLVGVRRPYTARDLAFAEEIGRRAGVAIDNARLYEEARAANKAKSLFLANMSHEIRTPLGAIIGFTDLLKSGDVKIEEAPQYLDIISRNSKLLHGLINDILDLSKIEAGFLETEKVEISLSQVIDDVMASFNLKIREKKLEFTIHWDPSAPRNIYSDPVRLKQILINLIGNAVKFTEKGSIRLFVKNEEPSQITFTVEDTGPGISPEYRDRIFEWFTQGDASTTRKFGGTGLGLSLARLLARALGGDIVLDQDYEPGSRFIVTINIEP